VDITGEYSFDIPQPLLWDVLRDPKALSLIIPLVTNMQQVAANQYTGSLFLRVGSMSGKFDGKIELLNMQAPTSYDLKVHGSSTIGQVSMTGGMRLEPHNTGTTLFYEGNINYGGRIASVGSRLLEVSTRSLVQQSLETLNTYLSVKYKQP
jgi:uncharacterized protein